MQQTGDGRVTDWRGTWEAVQAWRGRWGPIWSAVSAPPSVPYCFLGALTALAFGMLSTAASADPHPQHTVATTLLLYTLGLCVWRVWCGRLRLRQQPERAIDVLSVRGGLDGLWVVAVISGIGEFSKRWPTGWNLGEENETGRGSQLTIRFGFPQVNQAFRRAKSGRA